MENGAVPTPEADLKGLVEADKKRRSEAFNAGLQQLFKEHRCELVWEEINRNGQMVTGRLIIVPLE